MALGLGRLALVSPHLDDAVFSCGELIAAHPGAIVITVFAGVPPEGEGVTSWDAACGFASSTEAMTARRGEDRAALAQLQAHPRWLEFCDRQYGAAPRLRDVAGALRAALQEARADAVLVPLGLFHADHDLAHRAALGLIKEGGATRWLGYEDVLYRRLPGLLQRRLARLARDRITATPSAYCAPRAAEAKRAAVRCYASQLRGLATPGRPGHEDAWAPERYWELSPA